MRAARTRVGAGRRPVARLLPAPGHSASASGSANWAAYSLA